jgi:hypothetical protein
MLDRVSQKIGGILELEYFEEILLQKYKQVCDAPATGGQASAEQLPP